MYQLNAIVDIIAEKEQKSEMVTPPVSDTPVEKNSPELINLNINESVKNFVNFDFSNDLSLLASSNYDFGDLDWSREFSRLFDMVEELENLEIAPKQNEQLNYTNDKSDDWTDEYNMLFANEPLIPNDDGEDDKIDWSMEYKNLFGSPLQN